MATKIAINGFGRIGRLALRAVIESGRKDIDVVAINDLGSAKFNAHLLQYDSVHGTLSKKVSSRKSSIRIGNKSIKIFAEKNPEDLPWSDLGIDIVMECTGIFTSKEKAQMHLKAGAKRVLISAPATNADITVVYGVNHKKIRKSHKIISNASCTTNCLAPVAKVLDKVCGINQGYMTTVHAFTGDQSILDSLHSDERRARASSVSMIPSSTGAAKAVGLVLPQLQGRLDGTAVRVPTPNVSLVELVFCTKKKISCEKINSAFEQAAKKHLNKILEINYEKLVSIDYNHNSSSAIVDASLTNVVGNNMGKISAWYDNEWGFSNRMCDTAIQISKLI